MRLVEFKFVVQAVLLEVDDDGNPVGEKPADPVALYGLEGLQAFMAAFPSDLASLNAEMNGGPPHADKHASRT